MTLTPFIDLLAGHLPHSVPQILINRDPITHVNFDIHLLGDGDTIVKYLCSKLEQPSFDLSQVKLPNDPPTLPTSSSTTTTESIEDIASIVPERVAESHVYLFPGANGGRWVESIRAAFEEDTDDEDAAADTAGEGQGEGGSREGLLEVPEAESRSRSRSEPASSDEEKEEGLSKKIRFH